MRHVSAATILGLLFTLTPARAQVTVVSAASFDADRVLAPGSIASAFGENLAPGVEAATEAPLPTSLQGVTVTITDLALRTLECQLFFVSPGQINFLLPDVLAEGPATVRVRAAAGLSEEGAAQSFQEGTVTIASVSPGLFNQTELSWAAALLLRVAADGTQTRESIYHAPDGVIVPRVLELSPGGDETDELYLELFGTGFTNVGGVEDVLTLVGNSLTTQFSEIDIVPTLYAGPQGGFAGLDQVTAGQLTRRLEFFGGGVVPVRIATPERASNVVWMSIARNPNAPQISNLAFEVISGSPPRVRHGFDFEDGDGDLGPMRMIITWEDAQRFCTKVHDLAPGPFTGETSGRVVFEQSKPVGIQLGPIISAVVSVSDPGGHVSNLATWMPEPAGSMPGFAESCDNVQTKQGIAASAFSSPGDRFPIDLEPLHFPSGLRHE